MNTTIKDLWNIAFDKLVEKIGSRRKAMGYLIAIVGVLLLAIVLKACH